MDGSKAAVRKAVCTHLDEEVSAKDDSRAQIFVATVRQAMAALRYNSDRKNEKCDEKAGDAKNNMVQLSEEGEAMPRSDDKVALTEEGGVPPAAVATVRMVRRMKQREAKRQRARKAQEKTGPVPDIGEVERVVAELDAERLTRRRQQAADARKELADRWQRGEDNADNLEPVRVNLVRTTQVLVAADGSHNLVEVAEASDGLPTAMMLVDGQQQAVKIDSGARYSVAGTDWMLRGERVRKTAPVAQVEGIGGFLLDVLGLWKFTMKNVFGQNVEITACIIEGCTSEFLVGVDFLEGHKARMDFKQGEVRYDEHGREVVIPFRTKDASDERTASVRLAKTTTLARRAVQPVEVAVAAQDGEEGVFIPTVDTGAVLLATAVTKVQNGKAIVPAISACGGRVKLPSKKELGMWVPIGKDMELLAMNKELQTDRVKKWLDELGDSETPLENEDDVKVGKKDSNARELVLKLLRSYRKLSSAPSDCPPSTTLNVEHHIDTGNAAPILMKRRRHAQSEDATVDENVNSMLNAGVIEESDGAWGFPVVLVKKKDGSVRFCVDYRALNSITKRDVYPLPRIDETLETLSGARLFTTLDLQAGYWQIRVARSDRDKTAFLTKRGLYRFKRMPFGLTNAPATFQRLMNGVLRGLTWTTCLVYLDDIVVFTKGSVERHIVEVASVLERLASAGLSLKLKKCTFVAEEIEYLGHTLSGEGVQPTERLIKAVADFPRPTDATEVKRFVHLAGYYRKFIEGFGTIAAPMTRLLKKEVPWQWTEDQEQAFERLKYLLTTRPVLKYPDFGRTFRLATDASKVGLGACLMQDFGKGWQPVAYASKVNSDAEANYSITELECLAVVWSVKLFRPYLYGRTFTIVTDHAALKWLMTRPNLAGRLHRWSLTLQEYDFSIEYRSGATNVVADALSRAPAVVRAVTRPMARESPEPKTTVNLGAETAEDLAASTTTDAQAATTVDVAVDTAPNTATSTAADWTASTEVTTAPNAKVNTVVDTRTGAAANDTVNTAETPMVQTAASMAAEEAAEPPDGSERRTYTRTMTSSQTEMATVDTTARITGGTAVTASSSPIETTSVAPATTELTAEPAIRMTTGAPTTHQTTGVNDGGGERRGDLPHEDAMTRVGDTKTTGRRPRRSRPTPATATRRSARIRDREVKRVQFDLSTTTENQPESMGTLRNGVDVETRDTTGSVEATDSNSAATPERTSLETTAAGGAGKPHDDGTAGAAPRVTATRTQAAAETNADEHTEPTVRPSTITTQDKASDGRTLNTGTTRPEPTEHTVGTMPRTTPSTAGVTTTCPTQTTADTMAQWPDSLTVLAADSTGSSAMAQPTTRRTEKPVGVEQRKADPRTEDDGRRPHAVLQRRVEGHADSNDDQDDAPGGLTLQLTDTEVMAAQKTSKFVKMVVQTGNYRGMKVTVTFGLAVIETSNGRRVILPPTLWPVVFKEMHGSIWSGHLRGSHTYGRVAHLYWWPKLQREVNQWVRGCPECGSRKARPREVIPPLRSIRGGDVGDRWALDVAGPFPTADGGERFVIAAVEYVTRYAVANCVQQHTAEDIAKFLLEEVMLRFGAFRELLTDGAPELTGNVIDEFMKLAQAKQINPVPYRPQMVGLVERFHRTWKDCVAVFMQDETQKDWNLWVRFATYAYNSARHSTVLLTPNELMMGRRLRAPNELLRRTEVTEAGELSAYHTRLLEAMERSRKCAELARAREQERQARYYNRSVRARREFHVGDRVWMYNPPRGPRATKFVHQWMGPLRIVEPAGYDNFLLEREDQTGRKERLIAHVSFLVSYYEPGSPLSQTAHDIDEQLEYEDDGGIDETATAIIRTATAADRRPAPPGSRKRARTTVGGTEDSHNTSGQLVERRRRRRRNGAGHYVLEYQLFPVDDPAKWETGDGRSWTARNGQPQGRWISVAEYERLYCDGRIVEDPSDEEVV